MSVLTDQAAAALAAEREAEATEATNQSNTLKAQAKEALLTVIAPLTWSQSNLSIKHTDLSNRLVVVGDGTVSLAIRQNPETEQWRTLLVTGSGSEWAHVGDGAIEDLADLGRMLEENA